MPNRESTSSRADRSSEETTEGTAEAWGFFRSAYVLWIVGAIILAVVVHLGLRWVGSGPPTVEYSAFLDDVESGHVERVEIINDTRIEGTYTAEAVESGAVPGGAGEEEGVGRLFGASPRAFVTTKPADHELTAFLRKYNQSAGEAGTQSVAFSASEEADWVGTLVLWMIPLGLIVGIWYLFMRRMSLGRRMTDMGASTANLLEEPQVGQVTFEDVAGLEEAKEEVAEVVEFLRTPEKFTRLGGTLPTGVLLVGPPGTGKTLMAQAVAGEAGVPFFSMSGTDFVEMFVGVGASRVRDLFESAKEKAPCIIFIDEMDAIGRTRGRRGGQGNDERENTLNQLLVEMDGFDSDEGVVIMAATNRPDVLDSALLRPGRFDRQVVIHKPDRIERRQIFRVHVEGLRMDESVDLAVLARQTPGFAGAEIANVCNEAALLAARKDRSAVQMRDFEQAIDRVIAGLEKKNKLISPEEREIIAYHESGHAIVGWFLEHADPVVKVSIVPRGLSALGYAQHLPEERDLYSKQALLDRMTTALGGRVAEEIAFGHVTTGAQNDLERVTEMAYAMVVDYGMSDRLGPLSYDLPQRGDEEPLFDKPYSDAVAEAIDEEVRALVAEAQERAEGLLREKRAALREMAEALLEHEVLDADALTEILGERPHGEQGAPRGTHRTQQYMRTSVRTGSERRAQDGSSPESEADDRMSETPSIGAP